jgi:hypothetical protein
MHQKMVKTKNKTNMLKKTPRTEQRLGMTMLWNGNCLMYIPEDDMQIPALDERRRSDMTDDLAYRNDDLATGMN